MQVVLASFHGDVQMLTEQKVHQRAQTTILPGQLNTHMVPMPMIMATILTHMTTKKKKTLVTDTVVTAN